MRIAVIEGSPKGDLSITRQYVRYAAKQLPFLEFDYIPVGADIKKLESDQALFKQTVERIAAADAVLWATPVYFLLVPSQLKRFIELIFERQAKAVFSGKFAGVLMTSVHFYDTTAANYLHGISEDLGMKYISEFSAEMEDLRDSDRRRQLVTYFRSFAMNVESGMPVEKTFAPVTPVPLIYQPEPAASLPEMTTAKVVIVTDAQDHDCNLNNMINYFIERMPGSTQVVNLHKMDLKGGCLGCCTCFYDSKCVYRDEMRQVFGEILVPADIIIFAGTVRDRFLSARFKAFIDRFFYHQHKPLLAGKQMGYIISGPLGRLPNLRQFLEALVQLEKSTLVGVVTDEYAASPEVSALLDALAKRLSWAVANNAHKPQTFLGVGGRLVLRDLVYKGQGIFRQDHIYFKKHGLYDYPQKHWGTRLMNTAFKVALAIPPVRRDIFGKMTTYMVQPIQKLVDGK